MPNAVVVARSVNHGLNCFTCHDPHAARPRIVRDALIEAVTRPEADTLWHKDPERTGIQVIDMGVRGFPRKVALLDKYDTRLLCGQCHVEYNCNDGSDPRNPDASRKTVGYDSGVTNHFPYKDVFGLHDHCVKQVSFLGFRHAITGGLLRKAQHPAPGGQHPLGVLDRRELRRPPRPSPGDEGGLDRGRRGPGPREVTGGTAFTRRGAGASSRGRARLRSPGRPSSRSAS